MVINAEFDEIRLLFMREANIKADMSKAPALANSEDWNPIDPMYTHERAPLTSRPVIRAMINSPMVVK